MNCPVENSAGFWFFADCPLVREVSGCVDVIAEKKKRFLENLLSMARFKVALVCEENDSQQEHTEDLKHQNIEFGKPCERDAKTKTIHFSLVMEDEESAFVSVGKDSKTFSQTWAFDQKPRCWNAKTMMEIMSQKIVFGRPQRNKPITDANVKSILRAISKAVSWALRLTR